MSTGMSESIQLPLKVMKNLAKITCVKDFRTLSLLLAPSPSNNRYNYYTCVKLRRFSWCNLWEREYLTKMQLISCVRSSQLTGERDVKSAFLYQQAWKDLLGSFWNKPSWIIPCLLEWFPTEWERHGLSFQILRWSHASFYLRFSASARRGAAAFSGKSHGNTEYRLSVGLGTFSFFMCWSAHCKGQCMKTLEMQY